VLKRPILSLGVGIAVLCLSGNAGAQELVGDPEAGLKVFNKCLACHRVGVNARNGVGPVLNGVVGRPAGVYPGYAYSEANKNSGIVWDVATLIAYLKAPQEVVPGTKMRFPGLASDQDAADVVAYLSQFDDKGNMIPQ
jgi:cytochrome c